MTMFEIQEAAKAIIESVDPNAKIIFGAIYDEKLNKNEIKITVIASGFPENAKKKPMVRLGESDEKGPAEPVKEKEGPIEPDIRYPKRAEVPKTGTTKVEEEADDWASIPAFLRRAKKP